MVPSGYSFLLSQTNFKGPCSSSKPHIQILGTLRAPHKDAWGGCSKMWLSISGVKGLTVDGSGTVDGQGQAWWADPQVLDRCGELPAGIQFFHCDGLQMSGLAHINGPGSHVKVDQSNDVTISHLTITSPKDSPNTDGIDVANAERVSIQNCIIRTGDDCIAIKGGSHFINITEIHCGPGHGISVGSLGRNGAEEHVEDIRVWKCNIEGGESAARIKTWPGGKGYARRISFEHITVSETREPILIDQHYDHRGEEKEAVRVSEVGFRDIRGTCVDERAIVLDCAMVGCRDIQVEGIEIRSMDPEKPASAICNHAYGSARDSSPPVSCLSRYLRPLLSLV
ncbi:probable polygalacturonase At3g15720 [Prosopis cineraria]|uniref:probable polygalacturonase At3g15720 n=1 Tax=Prosopis cineraria TaxID=364024 RepID=UPI00240F924B|nr:probable polygalacturonase At3g15720 [Prosopis cineraria]